MSFNKIKSNNHYIILNLLGVSCLIVYIIVGIGLSGIEQISRLASVAAFLGVILFVLRINKIPSFFIKVVPVILFFSISWVWAINADINVLGNYLTSVLGAVLFAGAIYCGWLRPSTAVLLLLVPAILNIYAYLIGANLTASIQGLEEEAAFLRFGGFIGHPSSLVTRLIAPFIIYLIFKPFMKKSIFTMLLGLLTFLAAIFAIYASGSKKSIVLIIPAIFIWLYSFYKEELQKHKSAKIIIGLKVFVFILFLYFISQLNLNPFGNFDDIEVIKRINDSLGQSDESTDERKLLVFVAPNLIAQAPIVGYGLGQFSVVSGFGFYSHNNFIEILVNTGLIGFIIYYYMIFKSLARISDNGQQLVLALLLFLILISLDLTGVTYLDRGSQLIVICIVLRSSIKNIYTLK